MALLGALTFPMGSWADDTASTPTSRFSRYSITYSLHEDGAAVEQRESAMVLLKPPAVSMAKKMTVSYDPRQQKAEVVEAYTRKPDGRRIDVTLDKVAADAASTEHHAVLTVPYTEAALGDTVVLNYRLTAKAAMFPGHFSVFGVLPTDQVHDDVRVRLEAPVSLWTQHQVRGMREVQHVEKDGRKVIEWAWENKQPVTRPSPSDSTILDPQKEPGYAFSTFKTYADIARAYGQKSRLEPTQRVRKLAELIVQDQKARTPAQTAGALSQWVAVNIANTGQCLTSGAVVPQDLDAILESRSGDCKDHAALLQALLSAQGIDSTQALLNSAGTYQLPTVPTVSMLNHVINYIPSQKVFVDSTSEITPFGMLPLPDEDKPVFLVDGHQDGLKTPKTPVGFNQQTMKTEVTIRPDGSIKGTVNVVLKGVFAVSGRTRLRNLTEEQQLALVKGFFEPGGMEASGKMVKDDATKAKDTYGFRTNFEVKRWLPLPGAGSFTITPLFYSESPVADYLAAATQDIDPSVETSCTSGRSVEEYRYKLPPRMKIVSLPKNVKLDSPTLSYSATYQLKNQVLTVKRVFDDRTVGNVCTPAQVQAYKEFAAQAVPDSTAQVVFK